MFDGATRAVRAAITAQLALCRSDVPDDRRLPVRMGLHTGEAMFTGGDYVGMPIHVAARIMDAAHGGQILVSQATKELVADDEVSFTDAGAHVLKDIADAVRIHQVVHPDLRTEFPALRTVSTRTNNLPQRPTSFVGRDADVAQVEALLDEARVVTLSGVGGVGKTRLAVEVASRVATSYEDGVWLCELAPLVDAEAIVPAITSTLGIQPQPGKTVRESLLAALAQRESLVILDNCEHVLEPVARLVEDIVHGSAKVTVLATSRETIGVDGERSMRVRSLDEASVQLFGDRARSVRPDFEVDATNEDAVREVCAKLDGIPLAIELAAVRVTSMTPAQIAERLERDLRFLRSGRRAAVDRHRTLHAAIDSSYDALSEVEKLLFERLSVFAGGFDLDGAEEVCGRDLDVDVADGLASLVAKSMVDCDVTGERARFTLLETMRQYGQDCLTDRGQAEDTLRAHAEYVARSVELERDRFVFEAHFDPRRARAAFDNVRAAWAWARSAGEIDLLFRIISGSFFALEVGFEEVWHWSEEALAMPELEDHPLRSEVLAAVAHGAQRAADLVRSRRLCLEAIDRLDDPDDPRQVFPLNQLFVVLQNEGELDEARRCNQELVRIAKLHGVVLMESWAPMLGSLIESASGEFDAAVAMAEEGLRRAKGTSMEALGLYFLGDALQQAGDDERALECLEESLRRCREMDWRFFVTINLTVLAQVRARHGDPHEALRMFREVIDHWRRAGVWIRQWVALLNLIEVFGRLEMDEAAIVLLAAAESSSSAAPAVGPQGERLEALRREVTEHIGDDAVAAATARGRAMSDEDAVAFAKAEIDRVLALDGAQA